MSVSDCLPKPRTLKIKFLSKKTHVVVLKSGSCDCAENLNGNKETESRKVAPHSLDSLKLYGVDSLKVGSPAQITRKRGLKHKATETRRHLCPRKSSPVKGTGLATPTMSMKRKLTKEAGEAMWKEITGNYKMSYARNMQKKGNRSNGGSVKTIDESSISDPDSILDVSALDEENDGWTPHAAMLKPKQKTLFDHVERQKQVEKARIIKEQIRAAKAASTLRALEELRIRRENEREAARIALQKMEKTVEIEDNMKVMREFEIISRSMPSNYHFGSRKSEVLQGASQGGRFANIMEELGLIMKNDYMDYEDEEDDDWEEGEIR